MKLYAPFLESKRESKVLIFILLLKALLLAALLLAIPLDLSPDEAQYWTWSRHLDWGYYSKPPAIAWQIWLTTHLLGNTALGVRLGALLIGFLTALVIYYLARCASLSEKQSFWAALAFAFSPMGFYLTVAATTDGGAILFLTLGTALFVRALSTESPPHYGYIGLCILCGALFKWTAFFLWPFILGAFFFRPHVRRWNVLLGIAISACALLPTLYWNLFHDWATFKHVGTSLSHSKEGNFWGFLGSQIALLTPLFLFLGITRAASLLKTKKSSLLFCGLFPFAVCLLLVLSFFKKIQPNWPFFLYPPFFVLIASASLGKGLKWGTLLNALIMLCVFLIPMLPIPYSYNPLRQVLGWRDLNQAISSSGYEAERDFLFGDRYQTSSLLSFYCPTKQAYFFNLGEARKNQFSYWAQMEECEKGKTGYFIALEKKDSTEWCATHYCARLAPYFERVEYKGAFPLGKGGKNALVYRCTNYLGLAPPKTNKF